ncbi:MAG: SpaA isopeptide-forming pilin-related protein [Patescibacteria group bacterium]
MSRKSPAGDGTLEANWCDAGTKTNLDIGGDDFATPGAVNVCKEDVENPGSLKICKYEDEDGNTESSDDQTPLADWVYEIFDGSATTTATTIQDGCVTVEDLIPGDYRVTEIIQNNWYLLNDSIQSHTFNIAAGQQTRVDFYNVEYSTISGYKYEDLDNNTSTTEYLDNPVEGWSINLFDSSSTSTPTSTLTTDSNGYFEFTNLIPGDYTVAEELQNSWLALYPTSTSFTLLSDTATSTYFVNYFEGGSGGDEEYCGDGIKNMEEECDGSDGVSSGYYCTNSCALEKESSGGGGFTQCPEAEFEFIYPAEKYLDEQYYETIVVSNSGNIILTSGVLTIDLPEDKLEFVSTTPTWDSIASSTGVATWNISALEVAKGFMVEITVKTLSENEAITNVSVVFDQTTETGIMTENIIFVGGTGGGPEEEIIAPETPTSPPTGSDEGSVAGTGETIEEIEPEEEFVPQVKGEQVYEIKNGGHGCSECTWWYWVLIVLFLAGLNFTYFFMLKEDE